MELPPKGSLSEAGFLKLLLDSMESKLTGMIRLEMGPVIKVVYLQQGGVAFASSNEKSDRLTEVLKRAGKLTPEQIEHAQARLKPNVSLGKTLVELGYISPKDLLWGARMQVESILHQLLFWDQGNYQVIEGPLPKEIVSLNMAVPQIVFDGFLKSRDRHWVLQHIGSPEAVYLLDSTFHEKNAQYKLPVEDTVSRMNGKRSLDEIAQAIGQDAFEICKAVAALQVLGMVQRAPEKAAPATMIVTEGARLQEAAAGMEISTMPPKQDISLGQVLQIPTVEELQQESEEEPEPTLIVAPEPPAAVKSAPEPAAAPPKAEPVTMPPRPPILPEVEEEEDTETIRRRATAPKHQIPEKPAFKPEPEPTQRFQPPAFGGRPEPAVPLETMSRRRRPADSYAHGVNWKKIALAMGLLAALATAGTFVYTRLIQKPPAREYPVPLPSKPLARPAANTEPKHEEPPSVQPAPEQARKQEPVSRQPEPAPSAKQPPAAPAPSTPLGMAKSGKMTEAARAWKKSLLPKRSSFTIQLEIACQENTVIEAFQILNDSPQVSVLPLDYHGKACFRVLYGVYATIAEAEIDRARLPQDFLKQQSPAQVIPLAKALQ